MEYSFFASNYQDYVDYATNLFLFMKKCISYIFHV